MEPDGGNQAKFDLLARQLFAGKKVQYSFDIDYVAPNGDEFKGKFTVHRPTIGEKIQIGNYDARLRQELDVDVYTNNLTHIISTLVVVVDTAPDWWIPGQLYDYELLENVYFQYVKWVNTFFRKDKEKHEEDKSESSS